MDTIYTEVNSVVTETVGLPNSLIAGLRSLVEAEMQQVLLDLHCLALFTCYSQVIM